MSLERVAVTGLALPQFREEEVLETILSELPVVATGHPTLLTPSGLLPVSVGEHGQRKYQSNKISIYTTSNTKYRVCITLQCFNSTVPKFH